MKKSRSLLLIHPGQLFFPPFSGRFAINESLISLFSYLRMNGVQDIRVVDLSLEPVQFPSNYDEFPSFERRCRKILSQNDCDVVAISCFTTYSYQASVFIGRLCREIHPEATIAVGGWHSLSHAHDFVFSDPVFDFVVKGSGEKSLLAIMKGEMKRARGGSQVIDGDPLKGQEISEWKYLFLEYGKHCPPHCAEEFPGLERLMLSISRGCPYRCNFCGNSLVSCRIWTPLAVPRALDLIEDAVAAFPRLKVVYFTEAVFGLRPRWRREFLTALSRRFPRLHFVLITRSDILSEEDVRLLKTIKIFAIFGIESLSRRMLTVMNKTLDPVRYINRTKATLFWLKKYNVPHEIYVILDHPGETERSLDETNGNLEPILEGDTTIAAFRYMHLPQFALRYADYRRSFGTQFLGSPEWWRERSFLSQEILQDRYVPSRRRGEPFRDAKQRMEGKITALQRSLLPYRRTKDHTDVIDDFCGKKLG